MSITKAIETARRRVFRDGRKTFIYDEHADATREQGWATVSAARSAAREALVRAALSSLNLPASTICRIAWRLPTTGSWTEYVRNSTSPTALDAESELALDNRQDDALAELRLLAQAGSPQAAEWLAQAEHLSPAEYRAWTEVAE